MERASLIPASLAASSAAAFMQGTSESSSDTSDLRYDTGDTGDTQR